MRHLRLAGDVRHVLRWAAALGAVWFVVLLLVLHAVRPDVGILGTPISAYGRGRAAWVFAVALIPLALAKASVGFLLSNRASAVERAASALFFLDAVATAVVALAPTDLTGEQTITGTVHAAAATVAFLTSTAGMVLASVANARSGSPSGGRPLGILAGASIVLLGAFGVAVWAGRLEGFWERGHVMVTAAWLLGYAWYRR